MIRRNLLQGAIALAAIATLSAKPKPAYAAMEDMSRGEQAMAMALAQQHSLDLRGMDVMSEDSPFISVDYRVSTNGRATREVYQGQGVRLVVDKAQNRALVITYRIQLIGQPGQRGLGRVHLTAEQIYGDVSLLPSIRREQGEIIIPENTPRSIRLPANHGQWVTTIRQSLQRRGADTQPPKISLG